MRRIVDKTAWKGVLLADRACVACGRPATNTDHVVRRGSPHFGDDVPENLLPLCGSGSSGCHGARHGSPYVDGSGRRWTPEDVRRAEGRVLARRPPMIRYVLDKLGDEAGRDYLRRFFYVEVTDEAS